MSGRLLVKVRRERGDHRSPYIVAEEIAVLHPPVLREIGRIGGLIRQMESTGRRDRRRFEIRVMKGTTARGAETALGRDVAAAAGSAAGVKKVCRRLRESEAAELDEVDTEIADLEERLGEARGRREELVRRAWARANVVRLAEMEDRARRTQGGPAGD